MKPPFGVPENRLKKTLNPAFYAVIALLFLFGITACQTQPPGEFQSVAGLGLKTNDVAPESILLREGDVVRVSFPGTPTLSPASSVIRRDGKIMLPLIGEVVAVGKKPVDLEKELHNLYKPQLVSGAIIVSIDSSAYAIYVSGAVLRPGKITSEKPLTALEAVMEAGVSSKANLKAVRITRLVDGHYENITINLDRVFKGQEGEPFFLKPSDTIQVPEKLILF